MNFNPTNNKMSVQTFSDDDYIVPTRSVADTYVPEGCAINFPLESEMNLFKTDNDYPPEWIDFYKYPLCRRDHHISETVYETLDPKFEMLFKPSDDPCFQPTEYLEKIDECLSKKYYESFMTPSENFKHSRDDGIHIFDFTKEEFDNFVETNQFSKTHAFEMLRRCHCCGKTLINFGEMYCNDLCRSYCVFYKHSCFWKNECILCPK